jgi:hypothetical protein
MNTALKHSLALLATAIALLNAPALPAQTLDFDVNLNTATLNAQDGANSPFYLDFQLNYGDATQPASSVTLSDFHFTGGSALGTPTVNGSATGSLSSTVTLTANSSSTLNELFQQFSASTTDITFMALVSGEGTGGTPTEFSSAILDNSLGFPAQLFTTAPDTESLVTLDLSTGTNLSSVGTFTSVSSADSNTPVAGVAAIPEPGVTVAVFGCAALLLACYARRSGKLPFIGSRPASTLGRCV